ncbi:MAG: hypothetical protein ABEH59_07390 [Halobacteriales archaeon]
MAAVETVVTAERESIATPIKVVVIGGIVALIEGVYDIVNANLYAGVFDGVTVTTGEIVVITGIAMAFALAMLDDANSERHAPSKRVYLVLGVLGLLTLVVGVLFTAAIALLGAGVGYWESRASAAK